MLRSSEAPLCEAYDLAMLDLDGVVYVGADAVAGAPAAPGVRAQAGDAARVHHQQRGAPSRTRSPSTCATSACRRTADDVVTSAQAAARVLVEQLGPGARVALLGGRGLRRGAARPTGWCRSESRTRREAVVSGYGPDVLWRDIMRAGVRVRDGLWWVASNTDLTIPTSYGVAPGHGVLVETLRRFSGVEPVVAGKPARPLLDETVRRVGGERPLMVGDRLDTDIEGAGNAGIDSLLVLTGVTALAELVAAPPEERPTYLFPDLGGLLDAAPRAGARTVRRPPRAAGAPPSRTARLTVDRARAAPRTGGGSSRTRRGGTSTRRAGPAETRELAPPDPRADAARG